MPSQASLAPPERKVVGSIPTGRTVNHLQTATFCFPLSNQWFRQNPIWFRTPSFVVAHDNKKGLLDG